MLHKRVPLMIALLFGCGAEDGDDSGAGTSSAGESTTATATTTVGSSTTQPSSSTTTTSAGESSSTTDGTTSTSDASSSSAEASSTAPSEESTEGGGVCSEDPEDDACRTCVKGTCCDDWAACQADEVCACIIECHLGGASLGSCRNQCGGESELYQALFFCGQMTCLGTCEWDCC